MERLEQSQVFVKENKEQNKIQSKIQIYHKCIANNLLSKFCINQKCENIIKFMCSDQKCKCNENHFQCIKESIDTVLKKINDKICQHLKKTKENVSSIFTKLIDKIRQFQQHYLKQVETQLKFSHLNELQKKIYSMFAEEKEQNFKQFDSERLQQLSNIIENSKNQENESYFQIKYLQQIQIFKNKCVQMIQLANKKIDNKFQIRNMKSEILKSSIIKNNFQLSNLIKFFNKKVKSINFVFKASQNDFDMEKYYQKCFHLQNKIILCQTDKNKILGGYARRNFNHVKRQDVIVNDSKGSSFVFSLTNNHKFQLKQKQQQISIYPNKKEKSFCFGYDIGKYCGNIFGIQNKANNNEKNYFNLFF